MSPVETAQQMLCRLPADAWLSFLRTSFLEVFIIHASSLGRVHIGAHALQNMDLISEKLLHVDPLKCSNLHIYSVFESDPKSKQFLRRLSTHRILIYDDDGASDGLAMKLAYLFVGNGVKFPVTVLQGGLRGLVEAYPSLILNEQDLIESNAVKITEHQCRLNREDTIKLIQSQNVHTASEALGHYDFMSPMMALKLKQRHLIQSVWLNLVDPIGDVPLEVVPGLFLSSYKALSFKNALTQCNIKHVIRLGEGYAHNEENVTYYDFGILDIPSALISDIFEQTNEIIDDVLNVRKENILVHCHAGLFNDVSVF